MRNLCDRQSSRSIENEKLQMNESETQMNSYRESNLEHANLETNTQQTKVAKTQYNWN